MKKHLTNFSMTATVIASLLACKKNAGSGGADSRRPVADFEYTVTDPNALPIEVAFTSTSENAATFRWDMGDGAESLSENPRHLYNSGGSKKVRLIVGNNFGKDTVEKIISIGVEETSPETWKEHWDHTELLSRVYYSRNTVVYFDKDVSRTLVWPFAFLDTLWGYVRAQYGQFGSQVGQDERLYAVFHVDKYGGGHPASYFDHHHDFRNVVDCGSAGGESAWLRDEGWNTGILAHEIAHIVEGASLGVKGSPAFSLWGDSKWAEIFIYDLFKALKRTADLKYTYDDVMEKAEEYPIVGSQWFRNWYFPIYEKYGGIKVLSKYFELLAQNFPKRPFLNIKEYTRDMTFGEYIHFMSGAAGENLQPLVTKAFGWKAQWDTELRNAKSSYPGVTYPGLWDPLVNASPDVNVAIGSFDVTSENGDGAGGSHGSDRMKDNDPTTAFISASFAPGFEIRATLASEQKVDSYMIGTTNQDAGACPRSWQFQGSNDLSDWTTLDQHSGRTLFAPERDQMQFRFRFENNTAYKYYRLLVQSNNGGHTLQIGEFSLWKTK